MKKLYKILLISLLLLNSIFSHSQNVEKVQNGESMVLVRQKINTIISKTNTTDTLTKNYVFGDDSFITSETDHSFNFGKNNKLYGDKSVIIGNNNQSGGFFVGLRGNGDSIKLDGAYGTMLNNNGRLYRGYGITLGSQSIVDGYMSVSAGTNTICSSNDAHSEGNETVAGRRLYFEVEITAGNDGEDYYDIDGSGVSPFTALGDQSGQFFASVDSGAYNWESKVFWDYPYFFINTDNNGLLQVQCTGVNYNAETNKTRVYYEGNYPDITWITSCRFNSTGTGIHSEGKFTSASNGEGSHAEGMFSRAWGGVGTHAEGYYSSATGATSHAQNYATLASGYYSHAQNYFTTASGISSTAMGENTIAEGRGSLALGLESKTNDNYEVAFASGKFTNIGDAQGIKYVVKGITTSVGPNVSILKKIREHTAYTGLTIVTGVQTTNTFGRIGEAGSWTIKWGFSIDDKYVIDSVNITDDKIYYTGDSLEVNDVLCYASYTDSLENTNGTPIGGLSSSFKLYVHTSGKDGDGLYVKIKLTAGGSVRDLTDAQESFYHTMHRYYIHEPTTELINWSFTNDGDDVGNGTTTGIRPTMYSRVTYDEMRFYLYGLADRSIRWVMNSDVTMVGTE